ncbi:MAG: hypothetical protein HFG42_07210 [Lachnospiraceae bacterium]|jgi:amidase|nr:hypothetical protein [Lachnospiraceae bacterium]
MKRLERTPENIHFLMDRRNKPRIIIRPGESLEIETVRADNMYLDRENPHFQSHDHVMSVLANPVTGPVYVEGAMAGDRLKVTIKDIVLGDSGNEGYYTYVPGQGVFANPFYPEAFPPKTEWCDVSGRVISLKAAGREIQVEAEPFIGTIGVAMAEGVTHSFYSAKSMLGNVDCHHIKKGSTIIMPVNVEGALLSLGDLHAKQGAGELLGCAVECDGRVTISVEVIKGTDPSWFGWPQVNTREFIGSLGYRDNSIEQSVKEAVYDMMKRLETDYGLTYMEAYMLVGQCVNIEICQMLGQACGVLATIDRKILDQIV